MIRVLMAFTIVAVIGLASVGCQTTLGKSAGETVSDARISRTVQGKLTADRVANFSRIDVDTERRVVNLSGVVQNADQKARAAEIARQVNGVKRVNNNLQIQSHTP
jgi:hyperosmotically inducible periplasmic protein